MWDCLLPFFAWSALDCNRSSTVFFHDSLRQILFLKMATCGGERKKLENLFSQVADLASAKCVYHGFHQYQSITVPLMIWDLSEDLVAIDFMVYDSNCWVNINTSHATSRSIKDQGSKSVHLSNPRKLWTYPSKHTHTHASTENKNSTLPCIEPAMKVCYSCSSSHVASHVTSGEEVHSTRFYGGLLKTSPLSKTPHHPSDQSIVSLRCKKRAHPKLCFHSKHVQPNSKPYPFSKACIITFLRKMNFTDTDVSNMKFKLHRMLSCELIGQDFFLPIQHYDHNHHYCQEQQRGQNGDDQRHYLAHVLWPCWLAGWGFSGQPRLPAWSVGFDFCYNEIARLYACVCVWKHLGSV